LSQRFNTEWQVRKRNTMKNIGMTWLMRWPHLRAVFKHPKKKAPWARFTLWVHAQILHAENRSKTAVAK
jgi:hypothetical protein